MIIEAYVKGVSTRKVDDLVKALGLDGVSKSEVSRICKALDSDVKAFLARPLEDDCPYLWLDATFTRVPELGRVVSVASVVAGGGDRRRSAPRARLRHGAVRGPLLLDPLLACPRQAQSRRCATRALGLARGLKGAIAKVFPGSSWQRFRVHFMRNLLSLERSAQETVAAIVRTVFAQPNHAAALSHLEEVAEMFRARFPQVADLLLDAAEDVLAHMHFPRSHRKRLHSTNPLERLHKEIKRRTNVVGIFPN
ncbi:IS256 family transposase [soil metagenome]